MYDLNNIINKNKFIYIYGKTNTKKTTTVLNFFNDNKNIFEYNYISLQQLKKEEDFKNLLNTQNILSLLNNTLNKKKIIIIDNIDYLQNNDKKIISIIIKYIRKKKIGNNNIIFIGTNNKDKKVLELIDNIDILVNFNIENNNNYDRNIKEIVYEFLNNKNINNYNITSDKTIVSLIYHENIINYINNNLLYYECFLNNMCNGDYYDRISFQKQLWQFNEMTFYIKVLTNYIDYKQTNFSTYKKSEIIFTKILTKYSNEYSNLNFIINLCTRLNCLKEDLYDLLISKKNIFLSKYKNIITNLEILRAIKILK